MSKEKLAKGTIEHEPLWEKLGIQLERYNASNSTDTTDDCAINAISYATGKSWKEVYKELYKLGKKKMLVFNDIRVISEYLKKEGYREYTFVDYEHDLYDRQTVLSLMMENKKGLYIVFFGQHMIAIKDNIIIEETGTREEYIESYLTEPIIKVWSKEPTFFKLSREIFIEQPAYHIKEDNVDSFRTTLSLIDDTTNKIVTSLDKYLESQDDTAEVEGFVSGLGYYFQKEIASALAKKYDSFKKIEDSADQGLVELARRGLDNE